MFITVPFLAIEAPTLTVDQPAEGATFENGAIPVQGRTTNADWSSSARPTSGPPARAGGDRATRVPAAAAPDRPDREGRRGRHVQHAVRADHRASGRSPSPRPAPEGKTTAITRHVMVAFKGVNVVVEIKGGRAWLKVWVDGQGVRQDRSGRARVCPPGNTLTFTGQGVGRGPDGQSSATYFTVNGIDLGHMNDVGNPETWLFAPPDEPVRTDRR